MHVYMCNVCECAVAVWCSDCVLVAQAEVLSSSPTLAIYHTICLPPAPRDWVPGICWDANSRPFLINKQWSSGTSGAHSICCEERPVLLRVPSPAPGVLLARLTVPA